MTSSTLNLKNNKQHSQFNYHILSSQRVHRSHIPDFVVLPPPPLAHTTADDMTLGDAKSMSGHYKGYPTDWRKASLTKAFTAEEIAAHAAAGHPHKDVKPHVHTSSCNH